jgi:peptidoglycan/LPS O-acetylase OafA/YrhL
MEPGPMLSIIAATSLATAILFVALLARVRPQLFGSVLAANAGRSATIDGLRGILASSVVVHHMILMQVWIATGYWGPPASNFQNNLGSTAVALFFMTSAHLFCRPLIANRGALDVVRLFEGRVMRIFPLYYACVAVLLIYVGIETGFTRAEPLPQLLRHVASWMAFGFFRQMPINGFEPTHVMFSQIWTLRYEWMLYFALPVIALVVRLTGVRVAVFALLLAVAVFGTPMFFMFVAGSAAGGLATVDGPRARIAWAVAGIAGLLTVVLGFHDAVGWPQALLLTPFFVAVLQGGAGYRLLGVPGLRFVGDVSFSIYLIHVFVIWAVSHWLMPPATFAALGFGADLPVFTGVVLAVIALSSLTYAAIERPLMRWRPISRRRSKASDGQA